METPPPARPPRPERSSCIADFQIESCVRTFPLVRSQNDTAYWKPNNVCLPQGSAARILAYSKSLCQVKGHASPCETRSHNKKLFQARKRVLNVLALRPAAVKASTPRKSPQDAAATAVGAFVSINKFTISLMYFCLESCSLWAAPRPSSAVRRPGRKVDRQRVCAGRVGGWTPACDSKPPLT